MKHETPRTGHDVVVIDRSVDIGPCLADTNQTTLTTICDRQRRINVNVQRFVVLVGHVRSNYSICPQNVHTRYRRTASMIHARHSAEARPIRWKRKKRWKRTQVQAYNNVECIHTYIHTYKYIYTDTLHVSDDVNNANHMDCCRIYRTDSIARSIEHRTTT